MAGREAWLRRQLRAAAWTIAALPADEWPSVPLEHTEQIEDRLVLVRMSRLREPLSDLPPLDILSLEPLQTFLPGCGLSNLEWDVIRVLQAAGQRLTQPQIKERVEERIGDAVSDGVLKATLGRMVAREVGILDNDRSSKPPGYQITSAYTQFLAWATAACRLFDVPEYGSVG